MSLFQKSVLKKYLQGLDQDKVHQVWLLFQAHFHNPEIQDNIRNAKEEEYQEGFVRDLFVNILGYTLKPQPNYNFVLEKKTETDATKSDGAMLRGENIIGVIELKDTGTTELDKIEKQVFGYKHKHKNCSYVITSNFEKLRFYINDATEYEDFNLFTLTEERFAILYLCLQQQSIQNDVPLKIKEASETEEENITKKLYADYSIFKKLLFENIVKLNPQFNKLELFKKTQKLLDRFLFILFAEDRLLLPPNSVREILQQWEQLKELDNYIPLYDRFIKYFGYLNTGYEGKQYEIFAYNGGLFAPDEILDIIKVDDQILLDGCKSLSLYDFESEVDVNILGHIFEHSLGAIEEVQAELEGNAIVKTKTRRKKDGVFYTPRSITKYIVENTLGALCTKKKEELKINEEIFTLRKRKDKKREKLVSIIDEYRSWLLQLTICDPACGSGAFLNQALEYLIAEHRYVDELKANFLGDALILSDIENEILQNNLFGVDINEEAVEIAKLSLWLRTARKGRKLSNLLNNIKCGNSLIDDPAIDADKAFNWQKEFEPVFARGGFDIVIGNPPYVTGNSLDNSKEFIRKNYVTAQYQLDLYILFIEKTISITSDNGLISFITPNSWLKNMMMSECRKFLLENAYLRLIAPNLPDIFEDASVDSSIFVLTKNISNYHGTSVFQYKLNDFVFKHLIQQENFRKNEKFIFSVEINPELQLLIDRIRKETIEVGDIFDVTRGVNPYDVYTGQAKEIIETKAYHANFKKDDSFVPELRGKHVSRYNYAWDKEHYISYGDWLAAPRNPKYFTGKRLMFREIIGENFVCTYIDEDFVIDRSLYIALHQSEEYDCKYVLTVLASKLMAIYFRFVNNEFDTLFPKIRVAEFKKLPIKKASKDEQLPLIEKAEIMLLKNKELHDLKLQLLELLLSKYEVLKSNNKLQDWPSLSFKEFMKELDKQKIRLSLPDQAEWKQYFETEKIKANEIQQIIDTTDREIDNMVYKLYGLSEDERKLIEEE